MQTQTNEGELDDELQKSAEEKLCREESQDGQPVQADGAFVSCVHGASEREADGRRVRAGIEKRRIAAPVRVRGASPEWADVIE